MVHFVWSKAIKFPIKYISVLELPCCLIRKLKLSQRNVWNLKKKKALKYLKNLKLAPSWFLRRFDKAIFCKIVMETHFSHVRSRRTNRNAYFLKIECCVRAITRGENPALITKHHLIETETIHNCVLSKSLKYRFYFFFVQNFSRNLACLQCKMWKSSWGANI